MGETIDLTIFKKCNPAGNDYGKACQSGPLWGSPTPTCLTYQSPCGTGTEIGAYPASFPSPSSGASCTPTLTHQQILGAYPDFFSQFPDLGVCDQTFADAGYGVYTNGVNCENHPFSYDF